MRVAIASDHAGVGLQETTVDAVRVAGHEPVVLGRATEGDDYPDVALVVGGALRTGQAQRGIVLCGSGAGVTVAANKIPLVRAALAYDTYTARQMVEHDDVNVLALGARVIGPAVAGDVVAAFVGARFSGAERHARRLAKVLAMEATRMQGAAADLAARGQTLWLDGLEATALDDGRLAHWVGDHAVAGATTSPDRLAAALRSGAYAERLAGHDPGDVADPEALAIALMLADVGAAADLVQALHAASGGSDGYVSIDLPPAMFDDVDGTVEMAQRLMALLDRPNVMVKVPATRAGHAAARRLIGEGIPVHVTLVYAEEQYRAAVEAYMEGVERRLRSAADPRVGSVVSVSVAPWDDATAERVPPALRDTVGLLAARTVERAWDQVWSTERGERLAADGALAQRLSFTATTPGDHLPPTWYVDALDIAGSSLVVSEATLDALDDAGRVAVADGAVATDTGQLEDAGLSLDVLGTRLQHDALRRATDSWNGLMDAVTRDGAEAGAP
ncbi:MAG TPA: RpiB/LacA/LacB family sugar-phosphate isomerase [Euzebyales bacterium]|nr:RpiB/LacA/LacB family sugar-phosphate isomerase [Euzebyales bacterium]